MLNVGLGMSTYCKTELGIKALNNRSVNLSARQRQLLLLIDSTDFEMLQDPIKQKIANREIVQQLIDMGLIFDQNINTSHSNLVENSFDIPTFYNHQQKQDIQPIILQENLSILDIKNIMIESLEKYCGLIGKQLILRIEKAHTLRSLKICQMQWLTELQESKISAHTLNGLFQQINFTLQEFQKDKSYLD